MIDVRVQRAFALITHRMEYCLMVAHATDSSRAFRSIERGRTLTFTIAILLIAVPLLHGYDVADDGLIRDLQYSMSALESTDYDDQPMIGWALHYNYDNEWSQEFDDATDSYSIYSSNWFLRDMNSVFVRQMNDLEQHEHMYPGITVRELNELHNEHPVLWYQQYPSLMWVSVRSSDDFADAMNEGGRFFRAVEMVAYNQYEQDSWFNIAGSPLDMDLEAYEAARQGYRHRTTATDSHGGNGLPWEYTHIDYSTPARYLEQGPRSEMDEEHREWILDELGDVPRTVEGAFRVQNWLVNNFEPGGPGDWRPTVNAYLTLRLVEACNEQSLLLASILRVLGFPAIHIKTVDVDVAATTAVGRNITVGHDMVEAYIEADDKWILMEGFSFVETDYDPTDPYIVANDINPLNPGEPWRLFVVAKGLDQWDYGILSDDDITPLHSEFIRNLRAGNLDRYFDSEAYDMDKPYD